MSITVPRAPLKRGELAKRSGCNIETIRYYENIGLMTPNRTERGHRVYSAEDQARLGFIIRSRELGFSIEEIRGLLAFVDTGSYTCGDIHAMTMQNLENVQSKIADLKKLEERLNQIAEDCERGDTPDCPIIDALCTG